MYITIDRNEAEVLRDLLRHALTQVRVESARTDTHDYRALLHHKEDVIEAVLNQLDEQARVGIS